MYKLILKIFFVLIQVTFSCCFAKDTDNSFKMRIDAISLNNQTIKDYYIHTWTKNRNYLPEIKSYDVLYDYYPEATLILEQELNKQNYKKVKDNINYNDPIYLTMIKISFRYYMHVYWDSKESFYSKEYPYDLKSINTPYHKAIKIEVETNEDKTPLWEISIEVQDDNYNLRIYIPSMIKCAAPYFNKNFKGTVTCKR